MSRETVLGDLAYDHIIPAYVQLVADFDELDAAVSALCEKTTDASLESARQALAAARWTWSYTEAMWVGPVMERKAWFTIDSPIEIGEIEELIDDASIELDQERLTSRIGSDQRGLGAIEYILRSGDVPQNLDGRRCDYLTGVTQVAVTEAAFLPDDWAVSFEEAGPYRDAFASSGESVDSLVNDSLFLLEAVADAELGVALGEMEGPSDSEAIIEGPSGLGVADLTAHLSGLRVIYLGDENAPGLNPLLGEDLAKRLSEQFDAAEVALSMLKPPLRRDVEQRPEAAADVRDATKAIQATVATEVVAKLGVTIGFSDADGDSG